MAGVCRGAQFLAVMNGYKLYQHIDNHQGDHHMWDCRERVMYERISSVHHQAVIPGVGMEIIATAHKSMVRYRDALTYQKSATNPFVDVEAYYIRDTGCFGVQGHPEYKTYNAFAKWYLDMIYELFCVNPDFEWRKDSQRLRLKQDIINQRGEEEKYVVGVNANMNTIVGEK